MTRKVVSEHHDNYSSLLGCNSITANKIIGAFKDTGKEAAQLVNPEQKKTCQIVHILVEQKRNYPDFS